jgi:hypothetical protein
LEFHSGREDDHSPPSSAEVKEWVDLYLHSLNTPSWRGAQVGGAMGQLYLLPFTFYESLGQVVGLLGRGISPTQGLYLHRTTQHKKTRTHIHASSGIRTTIPMFERPKTVRALDRAVSGNSNNFSIIPNSSIASQMSQCFLFISCPYSLFTNIGRYIDHSRDRLAVCTREKIYIEIISNKRYHYAQDFVTLSFPCA